jgi:predicted nuclease of predicted toxin-antitoxin system
MRILIDECLDWRLCRALSEHPCASVHQMNWEGLSNGLLLEKAEQEFDVLLTGDTNLSFQQNVTSFNIAVVVLQAGSTRLADTIALIPAVLKLLPTLQSGQVVRVTFKSS